MIWLWLAYLKPGGQRTVLDWGTARWGADGMGNGQLEMEIFVRIPAEHRVQRGGLFETANRTVSRWKRLWETANRAVSRKRLWETTNRAVSWKRPLHVAPFERTSRLGKYWWFFGSLKMVETGVGDGPGLGDVATEAGGVLGAVKGIAGFGMSLGGSDEQQRWVLFGNSDEVVVGRGLVMVGWWPVVRSRHRCC